MPESFDDVSHLPFGTPAITCWLPGEHNAASRLGVVDYLANGDRPFPKERLEVFCGGRVAVLDDFRSLELVRDGRRRLIRKAQDKGWYHEWAAFSQAIRQGGEPPIPYAQLAGVTRATFAAVESLRTGLPVSIQVAG